MQIINAFHPNLARILVGGGLRIFSITILRDIGRLFENRNSGYLLTAESPEFSNRNGNGNTAGGGGVGMI